MFINDNTSKERVEIAAIEMRVRKRGELWRILQKCPSAWCTMGSEVIWRVCSYDPQPKVKILHLAGWGCSGRALG
jgi:hypothetical protein